MSLGTLVDPSSVYISINLTSLIKPLLSLCPSRLALCCRLRSRPQVSPSREAGVSKLDSALFYTAGGLPLLLPSSTSAGAE